MKRAFLIVLDSLGIGPMPDAPAFGDGGANTLAGAHSSGILSIPNMIQMGLGSISGVTVLPAAATPTAAYARCAEASAGKDTTVGHWEIAGLPSDTGLPVFPNGFPKELLDAFSSATGRGVLCNRPYSGTEVIRDYGEAHLESGALIVYTSADSVFQIAAHESLVPPEQLYEYCRIARSLLVGPLGVGRVIARPFVGEAGAFTRTANRRDFSLEPPRRTLLDAVLEAGQSVIAVGKIADIFAGRGVSEQVPTHGNREGMEALSSLVERDFSGLCFVNLVDFDMLYGHRRDPVGYARALNEFDRFLSQLLPRLREEDILIITGDHGCDPTYTASTDHTREYTPLLLFGAPLRPTDLGTLPSFADIGATVADYLGVPFFGQGRSHLSEVLI